MSRRLNRVWLLLACLMAGEALALGLGDIQLDSALNEPLRADIQLISATPDELAHLTVSLASADTFERYGVDRPLFMSRINFTVVPSGRTDGNVIRVTSAEPVTEPFLTFLVEASWSRGRLLREYTLLLDPPTFVPPPSQEAPPAVAAPRRTTPADSGRITRTPPSAPAETPARTPRPRAEPRIQPAAQSAPSHATDTRSPPVFDDVPAGDVAVHRGDTLWGIARRVLRLADNRLTMNQTMLAIYAANPQAFAGNINRLSAGAVLRIPSSDEIFRINRGDALSEVQRQNADWGGVPGVTVSQPEPSLTLVPPDEDSLTSDSSSVYDADDLSSTFDDDQAATDTRIFEVRGLLEDHQDGLIEIGDNELAALRAELVAMTGEALPPELLPDDEAADDDLFVSEPVADDRLADDNAALADATTADDDGASVPEVVPARASDDAGLLATITKAITGIWGLIGAALLVVIGVLVWFARRAVRSEDESSSAMWDPLDAEEGQPELVDSTEQLRILAREEDSTMVVVEEAAAPEPEPGDIEPATMEIPAAEPELPVIEDALADTGSHESIEDTFSSDTAINLDQSDPVAEADFHMAYGLYDQAADLINGALAVEPEREDLLTKLCEIYFVWGNRDAFVDAAIRLKRVTAFDEGSEWDKIVIMGQQIAADHDMFADVAPGAATRAMDVSFEGGTEQTGALDLDFAVESGISNDNVIDLGADDPDGDAAATQEMTAVERSVTPEMLAEGTIEAPTVEAPAVESTIESPTIEHELEATGEMPSLGADDATEVARLDDHFTDDATAEIDLDDLGLDLASLAESGMAHVTDTSGDILPDLDETGESPAIEFDDSLAATGRNTMLGAGDLEATEEESQLQDDSGATGMRDPSSLDSELAATSEMPTLEELAGSVQDMPATDPVDTDVGLDASLLDATGQTQVLPDDFVVPTGTGADFETALADDEVTMLASLDDDEDLPLSDDAATLLASLDDDDTVSGDFDYAKTEALEKDVFIADAATDDTGVMPESAEDGMGMDLDLDDLTAALKISSASDTVNQTRDDETVEQPRPVVDEGADDAPAGAIGPDSLSGDLHDARTMTEVGTKLDLARAYVDMGDPSGARSILDEVIEEGDEAQRQQAQQLLDSLPS